ncbi:MAG TPA: diguanylate cyclase [Pyrinomonadaceae bacterium]|jgi:diguanylate cyclase (GGDEF)-like protein|nr:diguanylate cyclase [Pyrinomonadaceae bacterium]
MINESPIALNPQEHREDAPPSWAELQDSLAESAGLALLLVDGHQPPAIVVSNNNSVCNAFQSSPEYAEFCDPYCGAAHSRATKAGGIVEYKCHAGLSCFAKPVEIGAKRNLAVIGGRAFVKSSDYQQLRERLRTGDLQGLASDDVFSNILFAEPQRLTELAERLDRALHRQRIAASNGSGTKQSAAAQPATATAKEAALPVADQKLEQEVQRLRNELEYRTRFADSLQHFLERISCADPVKTYNAIISNLKEMLRSERTSLMVLDPTANELILKAASGFSADLTAVGRVRIGEGVSGEVINTGKPVLVTDVRTAGRKPAPPDRRYKTSSFISYPVTIGGRKVGVLNITDKSGGGAYDEVDLGLLEILGPQVALALERAEWQERATEFQLMSITDSLTTLPNRRYMEERLAEELNRSKRYDYPTSFLMIDIDDFKVYNDKNGHQAGDVALQIAAHCLKSALRAADVASRYGGEEFCILLPQTAMAEAGVIADRIRQRVSSTQFPHGKTQPLGRVTISVGVSTFSKNVDTSENIIAAADRALYRAKSLGKDRVEFYGDAPS